MTRKQKNKRSTNPTFYMDLTFESFVKTHKKELIKEYCEIDADGFNKFCVYKYNKKLKNG